MTYGSRDDIGYLPEYLERRILPESASVVVRRAWASSSRYR
jgi:hypothetical protein